MQAGPSLYWLHIPLCWKSLVEAQLLHFFEMGLQGLFFSFFFILLLMLTQSWKNNHCFDLQSLNNALISFLLKDSTLKIIDNLTILYNQIIFCVFIKIVFGKNKGIFHSNWDLVKAPKSP